ncbi:unnamed protein product [Durusdinium trenchii]|uniref:Uncharacterized protein n=1 Tax=Durusdinium trenchii TaxID=1381693 RepID=A0ABP0MJV1_9DINO
MDDWDPFADPGDAEPAPAAKAPAPKPISAVVRKADDIFAALRAEAEEEEKAPAGSGAVDVQQRLDTLFGMDDEEVELLRQEFAGVTADCGGQHFFPMWRRALPLLEKTEAPCSNLLGLMIDDCVGLLADPSSWAEDVGATRSCVARRGGCQAATGSKRCMWRCRRAKQAMRWSSSSHGEGAV